MCDICLALKPLLGKGLSPKHPLGGGEYLGSTCSPSRYSNGYMVLRGCPGSAMPSGGDTGSIPSSPLPRADVLLGSGDLGGKRARDAVRAQSSPS